MAPEDHGVAVLRRSRLQLLARERLAVHVGDDLDLVRPALRALDVRRVVELGRGERETVLRRELMCLGFHDPSSD